MCPVLSKWILKECFGIQSSHGNISDAKLFAETSSVTHYSKDNVKIFSGVVTTYNNDNIIFLSCAVTHLIKDDIKCVSCAVTP